MVSNKKSQTDAFKQIVSSTWSQRHGLNQMVSTNVLSTLISRDNISTHISRREYLDSKFVTYQELNSCVSHMAIFLKNSITWSKSFFFVAWRPLKANCCRKQRIHLICQQADKVCIRLRARAQGRPTVSKN